METIIPSQKLKAYVINQMVKMRKNQQAFFEEMKKEKSLDDILKVSEVCNYYKVSRKTFDRWVDRGLKIIQEKPNATIFVKRANVEQFLNRK
ncbi:helix-turn-helix domain-containing protein [Croceibacter atlanticus]|uniref:helix-turn-helix domain-containing protein n=1 Tax=Croceibacter atlanticus TaxID=313588 RepID=UPI002492919E|nr:helix-turn-helix domain-containing protein [Croceibacter atlanticus]